MLQQQQQQSPTTTITTTPTTLRTQRAFVAQESSRNKEFLGAMTLSNLRPQCITEYLQVGDNLAVQLQVHPITAPASKETGVSEYWFCDRHLQEVLQLIKKPLFDWMQESREDEKQKKNHEPKILTGNTIRLVYTFKKNPTRQYFLIMNLDSGAKSHINKRFQNLCLKSEKIVVFVCRKEKGFSPLLTAVSSSANKTSETSQTLTISDYFGGCDNNEEQPGSVSSQSGDDKLTKREKLKTIVSREKRFRSRKRNTQHLVAKSKVPEVPEDQDSLKSPKKLAENKNKVSNTDENSKSRKSSNSCKNAKLVNEKGSNDDLVNKKIVNKRNCIKELDSDGSTSSCENLPYYGFSKSSNSEDHYISSSFEQDLDFESSYGGSPVKSPSKLSSIGNISASTDATLNQSDMNKNETKTKENCEKMKLQGLKDSYSLKTVLCSEENSDIDSVNINVLNLTPNQILLLVKDSKQYLRNIFQGKGISWRHKMYKNGGTDRLQLNYLCFWGCLSSSQLDSIMEEIGMSSKQINKSDKYQTGIDLKVPILKKKEELE
ncbi:Hypothetical predicted protein [Octopus vulgaris]|uniref:Uncharacterized protein n=1 Tax=Octopus vulgaris TaxID=6645 RepID=A0AA36BX54_OCTVU|nr:Hypothetical predicted protein [Octopus vulgaris]